MNKTAICLATIFTLAVAQSALAISKEVACEVKNVTGSTVVIQCTKKRSFLKKGTRVKVTEEIEGC